MSAARLTMGEGDARRLLWVQALETQPRPSTGWTADDRSWATRLTRETVAAGAADAQLLSERCRHVLQRLATREPALRPPPEIPRPLGAWLAGAALVGLLAGLAVDAVGSSQHINLLAPPVWGVIGWNLIVYLALLLPWAAPRWLRSALAGVLADGASVAGRVGAAPPGYGAMWLQASLPLNAARAAALLHLAALALAAGLVASLYLRGLVLDYRAGWQSTFLAADQVQPLLATLLAPASALTGIRVPEVAALQALRIDAGGVPSGSAAPWIHLYAAMLALFVVLPRALLAAVALARAARLSRRLPVPADGLYVQRLLHELRGQSLQVHLLAHGATPAPEALASLRGLLRAALGDAAQASSGPATAYGDEDNAMPPAPAGTTSVLLLADLGTTPEDDTHGRWLQAVRRAQPGLPLLLVLDMAGFRRRFATLPARVAERRQAWQRFAAAQGVPLVCIDLERPDPLADLAALQAAFEPGGGMGRAR